MALKILHTADWHLGLPFAQFDEEDRRKLAHARLEAVERLLGEAGQKEVDAVLCAGDLFDGPHPARDWWMGLQRVLRARTELRCPVVLLPGNHDPLVPGSPWEPGSEFRRGLPDHVHVVDRDDFELRLGDAAVIHAAPCRSQAGEKDLACALPARAAGDERIRIGLVHGQTFDVPGCHAHFPIARDAAERRGFDYLAIGDTHGFRDVRPESLAPVIYPGAPEQTQFDEVDAGGAALVFFPRRGRRPLVHRVPIGRWIWRDLECRDLATLRTLRHEVDLERTVLRLRVDMRVGLEEYREALAILEELKGNLAAHGLAGVLLADTDGLRPDARDAAALFAALPPVLRRTAEHLQQLEGTDQAEPARRALAHLFSLVREG